MSTWSNIRDSANQLGWANGAILAMSRVLHAASRGRCRIVKYHFVAQPIPACALAPATNGSITVELATPGHPIVQQFPRPAHVLARRFAEGATCFAAIKNGTLMGFIWIKSDEYMEDDVRCLYSLEPRQVAAWDFDVWVAPDFRLSRTFVRLWDAANAFMRERGYRWSVSRISAFNPGSLSSHRRLGIVHLHSAIFLVLGRVQVSFFSCAPYVHLSASEQQYPVLKLRAPVTSAH